jgi:L-amino acid N-acyltransferase YncA
MRASDWPAVRAIHAAGIAIGNATFETDTPEWDVLEWTHWRLRLVQ